MHGTWKTVPFSSARLSPYVPQKYWPYTEYTMAAEPFHIVSYYSQTTVSSLSAVSLFKKWLIATLQPFAAYF
ncbi:hypothetical protein BO82DRAFT_73181 [Aspergillus uvarum CBS 121591]|uniref:Uncharacterized protein n=1 Tax=Aspergillus uvarum CBS 121591 TaxID=1448315 RepID=A0A319DS63_9EURO|nr:hypothetical protein BO82DRAFT_73181 [Aspergillus uvarum CBS 121591]PYH82042.1 hypothetical protein BO82DRAFT_73181 [Aspergillus uvarum CBS 121591]